MRKALALAATCGAGVWWLARTARRYELLRCWSLAQGPPRRCAAKRCLYELLRSGPPVCAACMCRKLQACRAETWPLPRAAGSCAWTLPQRERHRGARICRYTAHHFVTLCPGPSVRCIVLYANRCWFLETDAQVQKTRASGYFCRCCMQRGANATCTQVCVARFALGALPECLSPLNVVV